MVLLVEKGFSANLSTFHVDVSTEQNLTQVWSPAMRMTSDTNTNGKTETKNAKLKIWDSKMRKTNRKTKMDSKKHGGGRRKGGEAGRKKKETKIGTAAKNLR